MKYIKNRIILLFAILFISLLGVNAQKKYQAELGLQGGANIYGGDINTVSRKGTFAKQTLLNIQPDWGAFLRYNPNNRLAIRFGYDQTGVKGNYTYIAGDGDNAQYIYYQLNNSPIHVIDLWAEYNFFEYEKKSYHRFSKPYSPYIFMGIGNAWMNITKKNVPNYSLTIPFGVGIKWKIATRWNFNAQWTNRLIVNDNLEGLPLFYSTSSETTGNWLNRDLLSGITIGISFDFWQKECDCNDNTLRKSRKIKKSHKKPLHKRTHQKRGKSKSRLRSAY